MCRAWGGLKPLLWLLWGDCMISLTAVTHDGKMIDYTQVMESVDIETKRFDAPGKMTIKGYEHDGLALPEGTAVTFKDNGTPVFCGYIFTAQRDRYGHVNYTAYDQIRYLKANASYSWENVTLEQIILEIAADFSLKVGNLAATGYTFPSLVKENESCMDIIFDALSTVIYQTGKIFCFYDEAGTLVLREVKDLITTGVIGDDSMMTDYDYKRDIDSETYNRIKLVRPNQDTGRTDVYIHEDTDSIKKWGLLQYYDKVDKNQNEAQIDQLCQAYLKYYNRVLQTLTIESMGITGIRAGMVIPVLIRDIEDLSFNRVLLVEKCTHTYEGSNYHTMSLEVKSFEQLGGAA